jgi:hypothetical protein
MLERDDLGPPVVPGGQEIGLGSRNLRPRAEARPTGGAVSRERLGDWDGPMAVCTCRLSVNPRREEFVIAFFLFCNCLRLQPERSEFFVFGEHLCFLARAACKCQHQ